MHPNRETIRTILKHALAWVGFALYEQAIILFTNSAQFLVLPVFLNYLLNALLFYTNSLLLLPGLYARGHYRRYALAALLGLATYALLRTELYLHLVPALGLPTLPGSGEAYQQFWAVSLYRGTFFQFISTGYWFAYNAIALETQQRKHEQELRAAERSLLEANLAFLKSQINPHFLFNSLNFLYAQVYPHSENAARGLLLLSDTMRYALQENHNGKVMLTEEVTHLHNYIELNQLRFSNQLQVVFETVGSTYFLMILPMVLITFVENCFKHGELVDPESPLSIRLVVVQNRLTFQTHNKKRRGPKEKSTGIGLTNTRKRLDTIYGSRYQLIVNNTPDYYTCSLTIDL